MINVFDKERKEKGKKNVQTLIELLYIALFPSVLSTGKTFLDFFLQIGVVV